MSARPLLATAKALARTACQATTLHELERATREIYPLTRTATLEQRAEVLDVLAPALEVAAFDRAVMIGYLCGALLEDGISHALVERHIVQRYLELAQGACAFLSACDARGVTPEQTIGELGQELPRDALAYTLLARATAPLVAALSTSKSARAEGRGLVRLLEPLAPHLPSARTLRALLGVLDDAPYVAMERDSRRAISGHISGISTNAQLHVLLMHLFPRAQGEPPRVSTSAVENALGLGPATRDETVRAAFTLHDWHALTANGKDDDPAHVLWNDGRPEDIARFEERLIVVLTPPRHPRSWRVQREFSHLRAELTVEEHLTVHEVKYLLESLRQA
jgi:hypothetical protein